MAALPLSAQIYKWIDKDGNIQFSDTDPEIKNVQQIDVQPPPRSAQNDEGEKRRMALVEDYQNSLEERRHQPNPPEAKVHITLPNTSHCNQAIVQEGILEQGMPVYRTPSGAYRAAWFGDKYAGPRVYVHDSDRKRLLEEAGDAIIHICPRTITLNEKEDIFNRWVDSEYCGITIEQLAVASHKNSRSPKSRIEELREQADKCTSESF